MFLKELASSTQARKSPPLQSSKPFFRKAWNRSFRSLRVLSFMPVSSIFAVAAVVPKAPRHLEAHAGNQHDNKGDERDIRETSARRFACFRGIPPRNPTRAEICRQRAALPVFIVRSSFCPRGAVKSQPRRYSPLPSKKALPDRVGFAVSFFQRSGPGRRRSRLYGVTYLLPQQDQGRQRASAPPLRARSRGSFRCGRPALQ